ncbi:MAG: YaiI/YqxD family protein [Clostridiales bacterium]|nr:YaiI/YqxD family protein [Clostridiales bacterium]
MKILIDGDACPVREICKRIARERNLEYVIFCDTSHVITTDYGRVVVVGKGADAVDFVLINQVNKGDVIVTQDYGVAAMALGKSAVAIHHSGMEYNNDNMDRLLLDRHLNKKQRRGSSKFRGNNPKKRTPDDDIIFEKAFVKIIDSLI